MDGLGFYFPSALEGSQAAPPSFFPPNNIMYREAFCLVWALHFAVSRLMDRMPNKRITVLTDSSNTFDIFQSLRTQPLYNGLLRSAMDICVRHDISLRVLHIEGKKNVVADALSRWQTDLAFKLCPDLQIVNCEFPYIYLAPRDAIGAAKK